MRIGISIGICILSSSSLAAQVDSGAFHQTHWFASGIAVGTVTAVQEITVDIAVDRWVRDFTGNRQEKIRLYRHTSPTCYPSPPDEYEIGTRYLFMMRMPNDIGAGRNRYWIILWQMEDGEEVCVDERLEVQRVLDDPYCESRTDLATVFDAMRLFEPCFSIATDMIKGRFPAAQTCGDEELSRIASRSPMHSLLVTRAVKWLSVCQ